jgi:hypothetical protein
LVYLGGDLFIKLLVQRLANLLLNDFPFRIVLRFGELGHERRTTVG